MRSPAAELVGFLSLFRWYFAHTDSYQTSFEVVKGMGAESRVFCSLATDSGVLYSPRVIAESFLSFGSLSII